MRCLWAQEITTYCFKVSCVELSVIGLGCSRLLQVSPECRRGWRSAGSWLDELHLLSFSGFLPLSAAASPTRKTSHFLYQEEPLCDYCWLLQEKKDSNEKNQIQRTRIFQWWVNILDTMWPINVGTRIQGSIVFMIFTFQYILRNVNTSDYFFLL